MAILRQKKPPTTEGRGLIYHSFNIVKSWQERRDSNPQPPVLETGALPIELHS